MWPQSTASDCTLQRLSFVSTRSQWRAVRTQFGHSCIRRWNGRGVAARCSYSGACSFTMETAREEGERARQREFSNISSGCHEKGGKTFNFFGQGSLCLNDRDMPRRLAEILLTRSSRPSRHWVNKRLAKPSQDREMKQTPFNLALMPLPSDLVALAFTAHINPHLEAQWQLGI